MASKNPRLNITFEPAVMSMVKSLAKREHQSAAGFAKELILEALERREDKHLSNIAVERDVLNVKTHKHSDVWK